MRKPAARLLARPSRSCAALIQSISPIVSRYSGERACPPSNHGQLDKGQPPSPEVPRPLSGSARPPGAPRLAVSLFLLPASRNDPRRTTRPRSLAWSRSRNDPTSKQSPRLRGMDASGGDWQQCEVHLELPAMGLDTGAPDPCNTSLVIHRSL